MLNSFTKVLSGLFIFISSFSHVKYTQQTKTKLISPSPVLTIATTISPTINPNTTPIITQKQKEFSKKTVQNTNISKAISTPTFIPSPTQIPTTTPTPLPKTPLLIKDVELIPPPESPTTQAKGTIHIELLKTTDYFNIKIFDFKLSGRVSNLKSDKSYKILLCMKDQAQCGSSSKDNWFKTDGSGNANISLPPDQANYSGFGLTVSKENPITAVVIVSEDECKDNKSPCLKGEYNLENVGF